MIAILSDWNLISDLNTLKLVFKIVVVESWKPMKMSLFYMCKLYKTELPPNLCFPNPTKSCKQTEYNFEKEKTNVCNIVSVRHAKFAVKCFLGSN